MFRKCYSGFYFLNQSMCSVHTLIHKGDRFTRARLVKRTRAETKTIFGEILEKPGKSKKKKNSKDPKQDDTLLKRTSDVDSEMPWVMAKSNSTLKRIVIPPRKGVNMFNVDAFRKRKAAALAASKEKLQIKSRQVIQSKNHIIKRPNKNEVIERPNKNEENIPNAIRKESKQCTETIIKKIELNENFNKNELTESKKNAESSEKEIIEQEKSVTRSGRTSSIIKPLPEIVVRNIMSFPIFNMTKKQTDELKESEATEILMRSAKEDEENLDFPSVTRILSETMSTEAKAALEAWKQRKINELGQEGFDLYAKELLEHGKMLHSCIEDTLLKKNVEVPAEVEPAFSSVKPILKEVVNVKAIESHVVHPKLQYRGFVDCVAVYGGVLCVIDWKKSDKEKLTIGQTYDAPIQIASYVGALNASPDYNFEIRNGIVVVAYTSGKPADVHRLTFEDLKKYWRYWLLRLQKYHVNMTSKEQS